MSDPFLFCIGTYCASCRSYGGLGTFEWEETGETLSARRRRLRRACPGVIKVWGWLLGPLVCAGIGAGVGWLVRGSWDGLSWGLITGITCAAVLPSLLAKFVWGIDYRAHL